MDQKIKEAGKIGIGIYLLYRLISNFNKANPIKSTAQDIKKDTQKVLDAPIKIGEKTVKTTEKTVRKIKSMSESVFKKTCKPFEWIFD